MPPAARVTDIHLCTDPTPKPHVGGPINPPCAAQVLVNGLAQARTTDQCTCTPPAPPNFIVTGSRWVWVEGQLAARMTDKTMHPPPGMILMGSPDVLIGGPTAGAILGGRASGNAACLAAVSGRTSGSQQQTYENCGVESSRLIINKATGSNISEDQLLDQSMANGDASNKRNRADSGGTTPSDRQNILANNGVPSSLQDQSMDNIMQAVAEKKGVITSHDAGTLWGTSDTGGHAINVIGVQYDENGNPINVITNDTGAGVCNNVVPINQYQGSLRSGVKMNVTNNPIY
jgi:uncharacterized Zn-binding protein involved in type VI secretion